MERRVCILVSRSRPLVVPNVCFRCIALGKYDNRRLIEQNPMSQMLSRPIRKRTAQTYAHVWVWAGFLRLQQFDNILTFTHVLLRSQVVLRVTCDIFASRTKSSQTCY